MRGNRLVIGVDYGTTYTGVAFCETSDTNAIEKHVQIIQDWPAIHSMIGTKEKVPSEIAYTTDGKVLWGSLIPPNLQRHMWTKLELENAKICKGEISKIRGELAHYIPRKPALEIVSDYLLKVKEQLIKNLDIQFGPVLWRSLPITLVITMPAIWSDAAKDRTLQAFNKAGFTHTDRDFVQLKRIIATTEPEAAALYTLKSLRGTVRDQSLKIDDGFVVCDMGGGTVDLISYRISGSSPTIVEEVTVGTGDQCGGTFVDREFIVWLERKIGTEDFVKIAGCEGSQCWHTSLSQKLGRMVQDFTLTAKSGFTGSEDHYLRLPAPLAMIDDPSRGMCDGEIHVQAFELKQMFESCLRKTCDLIADQVRKAKETKKVSMKYVFLVGGFAESPYMYHKINEYCAGLGLEAVKPGNAWSAIARGAVMKGLEGGRTSVLMRKSRRHYGTEVSHPFQLGVHLKSDAYINQCLAMKLAGNQMHWLVCKGQNMDTSRETHAVVEIYKTFFPGELRNITVRLMACDLNVSPSRITKSVYKVASVVVDLSDVDDCLFERGVNCRQELFYYLVLAVHISMQSTLEFYVTVNGKKCGFVTAEYD